MHINRAKTKSEFDHALGRVIASKRTLREFSQVQLSESTGIALTLIGRIEAGRRYVTVAELEMIADTLRFPAGEILEEAVSLFGGISKLKSEVAARNESSATPQEEAAGMTAGELDDHYQKRDLDLAAQGLNAETDPERDEAPDEPA